MVWSPQISTAVNFVLLLEKILPIASDFDNAKLYIIVNNKQGLNYRPINFTDKIFSKMGEKKH